MIFQIQSQVLELCVLAIVANKGDVYGYQLTSELQKSAPLSESTLYPVLRRLSGAGYLSTYDRNFDGRNRRYYSITHEGRMRLAQDMNEWNNYVASVNDIIGGVNND